MGSRRQIILRVCELLAEQECLKVTIKESVKGAGIIGLGSLVGGLLGGRFGLLAGAALGGAASMALGSEFKSVVDIIREDMTQTQRQQLVDSVYHLFNGIQVTDALTALALLSRNEALKSSVVQGIVGFVQQEISSNIL